MFNFVRQLRQRIGGKPQAPVPPFSLAEPEAEEVAVPEITVAELQQTLTSETPPCLLDVRELYEWRQVHMPTALHIPMNDVPQRLAELPQTGQIVVICAHGSRSYGVASYLIEQGYQASNLTGGITQWARDGGAINH